MTRRDVIAALHEAVALVLPHVGAEEIRMDRNLEQLGADSVDRIEILVGMTQRLGVQRPLSSFATVPDIGALIDMLVSEAGR
ncbi:MAG: phosphopantetheine-binding protein [Myxococcota bacterium]